MSKKKRFLLRLDPELYVSLERWAADELRSVNAQMEYLLQDVTRKAGRYKASVPEASELDGQKTDQS